MNAEVNAALEAIMGSLLEATGAGSYHAYALEMQTRFLKDTAAALKKLPAAKGAKFEYEDGGMNVTTGTAEVAVTLSTGMQKKPGEVVAIIAGSKGSLRRSFDDLDLTPAVLAAALAERL